MLAALRLTIKLTDSHERRYEQRICEDAKPGAHGCSVERMVRLSFHLFQDLDDTLNAWPANFVEHVIRFGAS